MRGAPKKSGLQFNLEPVFLVGCCPARTSRMTRESFRRSRITLTGIAVESTSRGNGVDRHIGHDGHELNKLLTQLPTIDDHIDRALLL